MNDEMKNTIKTSQLEQLQYIIGNRRNGGKIFKPNAEVHELPIIFLSGKCSYKNTNTLSKRFVVQHHKLIMHNHKFEHEDHDGRKTLKISKQLYTNIFLSCKPTVY